MRRLIRLLIDLFQAWKQYKKPPRSKPRKGGKSPARRKITTREDRRRGNRGKRKKTRDNKQK